MQICTNNLSRRVLLSSSFPEESPNGLTTNRIDHKLTVQITTMAYKSQPVNPEINQDAGSCSSWAPEDKIVYVIKIRDIFHIGLFRNPRNTYNLQFK